MWMDYKTKDAWLAARHHFLGASDAAAILGQSPWKSPYALWAEKAHGVITIDETERRRWGHALEEPCAEAFERWAEEHLDHIVAAHNPGDYVVYHHPKHAFIAATPDRIIEGRERRLLEIKATDGRNWRHWEDGVPLQYQIQVQHQLACCEMDFAWVAVFLGIGDFRVYECPRNETFIKALIKKECAFWDLVQSGKAPETDGSESTSKAIKALHPEDSGDGIELPADDWEPKISHLEQLKTARKAIDLEIATIENSIQAVLGACTYADIGERRVTWKTQTRRGYTVPEASYRVMRVTKRKDDK